METTTEKTKKMKAAISEEKTAEAEKPRYNKTWQAVLKFRGTVKVNDPTLFYR